MNENGGELSSFLQKLGEDSRLQQAYTSDPEGTMRQAGLSDDTIRTVLSRDLEKIKALVEQELSGLTYIMFMVIFDPPAKA
jgi:hypothetical protein